MKQKMTCPVQRASHSELSDPPNSLLSSDLAPSFLLAIFSPHSHGKSGNQCWLIPFIVGRLSAESALSFLLCLTMKQPVINDRLFPHPTPLSPQQPLLSLSASD